MERKTDLKYHIAHILLLIAGAVIFLAGCFQNSVWYDEAFTIGMMSYDGFEGLKWAIFDVHPHLYYFLLRLFTFVFGRSLVVMRIFSAIGGILFVSLGLTHIRKDFGSSVGFWFSFCSIFSASTLFYAVEIRMYTWAAYFVSLAAIYALRMYNYPEKSSYRVLFLIFSLASAYTHYFGLFTVAIINLLLLYCTIKKKGNIKKWLQNAAVQIGCYLPCAVMLVVQIYHGSAGWITVKFPDVVLDFVSYHILGDALGSFAGDSKIKYIIIGIVLYVLYILFVACIWKCKKSVAMAEKQKTAMFCAATVYYGVVLFSLSVSLFKAVYHIRYTVVFCGFLFFMMALLLSSLKSRVLKTSIALALIAVFALQASGIYKIRYHRSSNYVGEYLNEHIQKDDDILFEGVDGFVVSVQYPENDTYFYNSGGWLVEENYRTFGENTHIVDELQNVDFNNRVWTLGTGSCYKYLISNGYTQIESRKISTIYHNYHFHLILLEKQ